MAVTISWSNGDGSPTIVPSGVNNNTVGFFGTSFGNSVRVGEYQDATHVTNPSGTVNSGALSNNKFIDANTVKIGTNPNSALSGITIEDTTIRIHFNNSVDPVQTQNAYFRAYDRSDINNAPSGVDVYAYEASSSSSGVVDVTDASGLNLFGDTAWTQISGATALPLLDHTFSDQDHYYFIGVSASPTSIGTKTQFGFYTELEYL